MPFDARPLTAAQRERIITIDPENPPSFVGVIADERELWKYSMPPEGVSSLIFNPNWSRPQLFGRGDVPPISANHYNRYPFPRDANFGQRFAAACSALCSPTGSDDDARALLHDTLRLANNIQRHNPEKVDRITPTLYIENHGKPGKIHADAASIAFVATEHENVLLVHPHIFRAKKPELNGDRSVSRAMELDIPFYVAPRGWVTIMFGLRRGEQRTPHAAYEMPANATCARPALRLYLHEHKK